MLDLADIENRLAEAEAKVPNLRPDCAKRVIWAQGKPVKTPVSLLYIHGFSASLEELRPLPDLVAKELGANIHFTRLTGHGQDGAAMGRATFPEWEKDVTEAFNIAAAIGDQVIVMSCSTGCTMATLALAGGAAAKAAVMISPNYRVKNPFAQFLMDAPFAEYWAPYVAGRTRSFAPINDKHAAYWTTKYPISAVYPLAEAVRRVRKADLAAISTPCLFSYNEADTVVEPAEIPKVAARWGGPTTLDLIQPGPGDDANGHVMAGDVFSPGQTAPMAKRILAWIEGV